MKLTLIYPSVGRKPGKPYVRAWQMEPLSMAQLASLTPEDVEIAFHDDRLEDVPFDEPTDLVAISVETFTALRAYRLAAQFRARGVRVVLGGYHVTLVPEEAAKYADAIVVGDAESVWENVIADAKRGDLQPRYQSSGRPKLTNLRPRREIFSGKNYQNITLVEFARGCNFRCDFCSITAFHKATHTHRPARDVAAEMESTGNRRFFIVDDNIVSQPEQTRQLCRELKPLNIRWVGQASIHIAQDDDLLQQMVESGCCGVLIGMESLDPQNLRAMGKQWNTQAATYAESLANFRKHGLAIYGTFVFGYDNDTPETVAESVAFAREQKLFMAAFNHLVPFPGTPLYQRLQQQGRLLSDKWWLDPAGRIGDVTFTPEKMTPTALEAACLGARREFYRWSSIFERIRDRRANAASLAMAGVYLGLNITSHFDIDLRQGVQLGAGLSDIPPNEASQVHEPVLA